MWPLKPLGRAAPNKLVASTRPNVHSCRNCQPLAETRSAEAVVARHAALATGKAGRQPPGSLAARQAPTQVMQSQDRRALCCMPNIDRPRHVRA